MQNKILNTDPRTDFVPLDLKKEFTIKKQKVMKNWLNSIPDFTLIKLLVEDGEEKRRAVSVWREGREFRGYKFKKGSMKPLAWKYHHESDEFGNDGLKIPKKRYPKKEVINGNVK